MERERMSEADKKGYLASIAKKVTDPEVIALIKEDMEWGLSQAEIDDYVERRLKLEQRQAISDMHRKNYPGKVIAVIGATDNDAGNMRKAMELYEKNMPLEEIKKILETAKNARDMKLALDMAADKVQQNIAAIPETEVQENVILSLCIS